MSKSLQDLDQILAQVRYQVRHRVKRDIEGLVVNYKALSPKLGTLIHNDGSESLLVSLGGTIPIRYLGAQYHIPIEIYVPEVYPNLAPRIYVRPTSDMVVKPGHKHVDREGLVYLPYLSSWVGVTCTLLELCNTLASVFSQDPPLFSKPPESAWSASFTSSSPITTATPAASNIVTATATMATTATTSSMYQHYLQQQQQSAPTPVYAGVATVSDGAAAVGASAAYTANTLSSNSGRYTQSADTRRKELIEKVTRALQTEMTLVLSSVAGDIDRALEQQVDLDYTRKTKVEPERDNLVEKQLRMKEKLVHINEVKHKQLDEWVLKMDPNAKLGNEQGEEKEDEEEEADEDSAEDASDAQSNSKDGSEKVEAISAVDRLIAYDEASSQLTKLLAEQNAIEDAIYALDHALAHGTNAVDMATFLKKMRELSRKQFLCKIHIMKINKVLTDTGRGAGMYR